ncbi:MAG: isochorismatase family protein [Thermoanaerobaculia bacterium]
MAHFRAGGLPVTFIQHIARRPGATFFLPGTEGVAIHPSVAPLDSEPVIEKHYPNAFRETRLLEDLRSASIEQVVIAGMMTHMSGRDGPALSVFFHEFDQSLDDFFRCSLR